MNFWAFLTFSSSDPDMSICNFLCLCVHSVEDSTLMLIFDPFCLSVFLKGSPNQSLYLRLVLVASPLIRGYDATASSKMMMMMMKTVTNNGTRPLSRVTENASKNGRLSNKAFQNL